MEQSGYEKERDARTEAEEAGEAVDWELVSQVRALEKGMKQLWAGGILFVLGLLAAAAGFWTGGREREEPVPVYRAKEEDQYVCARVQSLSETFACYDAMEDMGFYLAFDYANVPAVLCFHSGEREAFAPYVAFFYGGETMPPELTVTGYAKPLDGQIREYLSEFLRESFGTEAEGEAFLSYLGDYYVQLGEDAGIYRFIRVAAALLAAGAVVLLLGANNYANWRGYLKRITCPREADAPVGQGAALAKGALGALAGAVIGGMLWSIVGAVGFYNFWLGAVTVLFSYVGYEVGNPRGGVGRLWFSGFFGLLILLPAAYLEWSWLYYASVNSGVFGYVPLSRVIRELPQYLSDSGDWHTGLKTELALGYACAAASIWGCICAYRQKRT